MFKHERADRIMKILKKYKYTTVDYLVQELHYSPATIRRDITYLANNGLVKKSYGGVSINERAKPSIIREHENIELKTKICQRAVNLINENNYIFIDNTTTTYLMGEYLDLKKNITVTTSNIKLASYLGEQKIPCYVTGGMLIDTSMLTGIYAIDTINKMHFDISFFSIGGLSKEGDMRGAYPDLIRTIIKRSDKSVCLIDSSKLNLTCHLSFETLENVDYVISDGKFSVELIEKFPNTKFITV